MKSRLIKILGILAVATLVAGCKFSIIVGEGGKVQSILGFEKLLRRQHLYFSGF